MYISGIARVRRAEVGVGPESVASRNAVAGVFCFLAVLSLIAFRRAFGVLPTPSAILLLGPLIPAFRDADGRELQPERQRA